MKGALHAPTAGIVCPYELAAGAVENAVENGTELKLECQVQDIKNRRRFCACNQPGGY